MRLWGDGGKMCDPYLEGCYRGCNFQLEISISLDITLNMNSMKLVIPLHYISWKKTPNDAVTPQRQSQFTPKMKTHAVERLLSSLLWIDQYNECSNRMTSFMEFICELVVPRKTAWLIVVVPLNIWLAPTTGNPLFRTLFCQNVIMKSFVRLHGNNF